MNFEEEESGLLKPDEVQNIKTRRRKEVQENIEEENAEPIIKSTEDRKFKNLGSTVKISLESNGRFGNPEYLVFRDYNAKEVNDLVTSREEDLLETLVAILNECVVEPKGFNIGKLTNEEFYEVLLGMKMAFDSLVLDYKWVHECQENVPNQKDRKLSSAEIDLREIEFKSIEQSDESIREFFKARFDELDDPQFRQYMIKKYSSDPGYSKEEELNNIKIKEPFLIPGIDKDYEFTFMRIGYLVEGYDLACKEFDSKIRLEKNRSIHNVPLEKMKLLREETIEKLTYQKNKAAVRYAQALCLKSIKIDGKIKSLSASEEKIREYNSMPKASMFGYLNATKAVNYGVDHEIELECNLCNTKERRSLQRWVNPFELLPLSNVENSHSSRKLRVNSAIDFCF